MPNKTEMLTEIVQRMIDGGWEPRKIEDVTWIDINNPNDEPTIDLVLREKGYVPLSISDLLSNHEAMKFLGEESYWEETSDEYGLGTCYDTGIPAYIYHIREAFTLPTDEERVEYVYSEWKGA
jgi:hypothetical protein